LYLLLRFHHFLKRQYQLEQQLVGYCERQGTGYIIFLTRIMTYEHATIPWVPYTAERRESNTKFDFIISNTKKKKKKKSERE
jgi:hypothetical protein